MGRVALKKIISFLSLSRKRKKPDRLICTVDDILWSVRAAARRVPSTTCLMRALVAEYLCKKNGINSRLYIGVRKKSESVLAAHAWVTVDGKIILGEIEDIADYTPLPESELLKL